MRSTSFFKMFTPLFIYLFFSDPEGAHVPANNGTINFLLPDLRRNKCYSQADFDKEPPFLALLVKSADNTGRFFSHISGGCGSRAKRARAARAPPATCAGRKMKVLRLK